jgi:hypothetical protein
MPLYIINVCVERREALRLRPRGVKFNLLYSYSLYIVTIFVAHNIILLVPYVCVLRSIMPLIINIYIVVS